jgi:anti-anti-sigma factor
MISEEPNGQVLPAGVDISDDGSVVVLGTTLDACTESDLHAMFDRLTAAAGVQELVVDLFRVEFCDAAGLRVLVRAWKVATRRGVMLHLRNPPPRVHALLDYTGVARLFGALHPDLN